MTEDVEVTTKTKIKLKAPSMWKVIIYNDDFTPMDFVIRVLIEIFNKSIEEAVALMLHVHTNGKATVGNYTKEVAETKVSQTMRAAEAYQHPLLVTAEEA